MKTEEEDKRKKEILLGINPCIYGLNYHDPAVVVLIDGRVALGLKKNAVIELNTRRVCFRLRL